MTDEEIKNLLDGITEENVDRIIEVYNQYIDEKFSKEIREYNLYTASALKKEYMLIIKLFKISLLALEKSEQRVNQLETFISSH